VRCSLLAVRTRFSLLFSFSWYDQEARTRRYPLWWANTGGWGVDPIRALHCYVCAPSAKSRFPIDTCRRISTTKIAFSAATCIFVDPILPMSEFICFGPAGQSDWRHRTGVHGGAVMHLVSSSRYLRWKASGFVPDVFTAESWLTADLWFIISAPSDCLPSLTVFFLICLAIWDGPLASAGCMPLPLAPHTHDNGVAGLAKGYVVP